MNKYLFGGLMLAAGLGIGGGISYLICKKKYEQKLVDELDKNQKYYIDLLGYKEPDEKDIPEDLKEEAENAEIEVKQVINEEGKTYKYTNNINSRKEEFLKNRGRIRYDKLPDPLQEETKEEVDEVTLSVNNDNPSRDICIITSDQFAREHLNFEKETLLWWPRNKLVSTEDYEILDVPDLIGTEWQDRIGEFEKDTVYVRNFGAETDYEIVEQKENYYEAVES